MLASNWFDAIKERSSAGDHKAVTELLDGVKGHIEQITMLDGPWQEIIKGAATCGLSVEITKGQAFQLYQFQDGRCALTGLSIHFRRWARGAVWKASDDAFLGRIDGSRGYVPGNVWWLHRDVSRMKLDLPLPRFLELCRLIADREAAGVIAPPLDPRLLTAPPAETLTPELIMDRYLHDRVEPDPLHKETAAALWQSFQDWCRVNGAKAFTQTAFGRALGSRGYESKRGQIVTWYGLRLKSREGAKV